MHEKMFDPNNFKTKQIVKNAWPTVYESPAVDTVVEVPDFGKLAPSHRTLTNRERREIRQSYKAAEAEGMDFTEMRLNQDHIVEPPLTYNRSVLSEG